MTLSIDELIDDYARDGVKRMSREGQKKWYRRKRRAMEGVFEVSWAFWVMGGESQDCGAEGGRGDGGGRGDEGGRVGAG